MICELENNLLMMKYQMQINIISILHKCLQSTSIQHLTLYWIGNRNIFCSCSFCIEFYIWLLNYSDGLWRFDVPPCSPNVFNVLNSGHEQFVLGFDEYLYPVWVDKLCSGWPQPADFILFQLTICHIFDFFGSFTSCMSGLAATNWLCKHLFKPLSFS